MATSQRLESLDSIRGLAALAVLFGHALAVFIWPSPYINWEDWPLFNLLVDGRSAVTMFFVLSGFVLSRPYFSATARPLHVPVFYLRRFLRIWLPWFFVFLVSLAAQRWWRPHYATQPPVSKWLSDFWQLPPTWADVARQCCFQLHDPARLLLPQDWSLGVELKGSALIPLFLFLARRRHSWLGLGIVAVLAFVLIKTGGYYVSFIIGVLLAQQAAAWIPRLQDWSFGGRLGLFLLGIAGYEARYFLRFFGPENRWGDQTVWVISSAGCALIILISLASRRIGHFLTRRPLVFIGRISYSVYLLQFVVLICLVPALIHLLNAHEVAVPVLFATALVSSFALTILLAWGMYYLVEVPSVNLGHWAARRMTGPGRK
ncbi:MAG TPA: acyltransferase [Dongiaceae bacterium]|nr:acyltransferase [Dongiaceae bacterium]